jgi:hypothetical protein
MNIRMRLLASVQHDPQFRQRCPNTTCRTPFLEVLETPSEHTRHQSSGARIIDGHRHPGSRLTPTDASR